MWQHWINFVLGLWVIASAFMGFDTVTLQTNFTIVGIVIAILALWGALAGQPSHAMDRTHSHA